MFRQWIRANSSLASAVTSSAVIVALVATIAIVSGGYSAQKLALNDASVWVANGEEQVIGRANTEVLELNTVVGGTGTELDVVQRGANVLLFDRSNNTVDIVDAATSTVVDSAAMPADSPQLYLAGSNVVVHSADTGAVWILPFGELANFDPAAEPTLSLGSDSVASVTDAGILYAFSSDTRLVYRVDASITRAVAGSEEITIGNPADVFSITSVGDSWAVLDEDARQLIVGSRTIDLAGLVEPGEDVVLQRPSAGSDRVLIASDSSLFSVPLDGSEATTLATGQSGTPIAPAIVDGCTFAAWSGSTAWRQCQGEDGGEELNLANVSPGAQRLAFAVNGDRVVLSDPGNGNTWAVQRGGELIDNWDELIVAQEDQKEIEENDEDRPPEFEKNQLPPVAVDDAFGARPGQTTVLPVLLNDYDPNGDVLVITEVDALDESVGRLDLINNSQQLQLNLAPGAASDLSFNYSISDGRGGIASATVVVTARLATENSPPVQMRKTKLQLAQNGRVTSQLLGDWVDPDGDAFYLTNAISADPDQVSYKPEGTVVFQEGGSDAQFRTVALVVSDGIAEGTGTLAVTVRAEGEVPIIADPFVVLSYAGQEVTVSPLEHVRGGTGVIRLSGVPEKPGATIEASNENGTFRFVSEQVRTHYLDYVVTDGDQTVTGLVRIDVAAPPDANTKPITIPQTVFVKTLSSETLQVAATDIDPSGGVLLVTGVSSPPVNSGVRAEVLEQRAIRVTLTAPLDGGPVTFGYRISNGLAEADGVVTVVEIPHPPTLQAPVATDDSVTVRVGDAIDIPILANDLHPDGEALVLNPQLRMGPASGSGLLFASGNTLRYLAPMHTGNFTAVYEVAGPDGQVGQAEVRIAVREAVEATNNPPVPKTVVARVLAGEIVSIRIPLTGVDPDGDSVQLLGQESSPQKGAVTLVGTDFIEYQAGSYSAGTDTFSYTVMDGLGARATGTVRVGISPRLDGARNPVANEDEVQVRPGGSVSVQVLANDSDPDGSALTVVGVEPNSPDIIATIEDNIVTVTPPENPGRYGLVYTIENEFGGTSSNFITVEVSADAPRAYPVARDTVLTLSDILDRETVAVDVLGNVFFAEGDSSDLNLGLLSGYRSTATVTENKRIQVTLGNASQIIPFSVTHPQDSEVVSYAFVWVPGFEDALPQLDRRATSLVIPSESKLTISLQDHVIAVGGKSVRLTDRATVQATHSNGDSLVVDDETITFTSADKYFGPASISFEVTDGRSASDPDGQTATLVLPITVTPRVNQPPVFTGGVIQFEPAEEKELDLLKLTNYPYPDDVNELAYSIIEPLPSGFSYSLSEAILTIRADEDAVKGSTTSLILGVRDDLSEGQPGRISLNVVASGRPLAKPAADTAIVPRGETTVVDVLANDTAANPFPGRPLRVVDIRGIGGGELPAGVTVVPSDDRSRLSVTVADSALPIDTSIQYQVEDATRDADRRVWGNVTLSVQDVPDAPVAPSSASSTYVEGVVTLRITAPAFNNSPITGYQVVSASNGDNYSKDCGMQLRCELRDLVIGAKYEFRVIAVNDIGPSGPSPSSQPISADYLPAAVDDVSAVPSDEAAAGGAITVRWARAADPQPGTSIVGYTVKISGSNVDEAINVGPGASSLVGTTAGGTLVANQQYSVTVYARNSAQATDAQWNRNLPVTVMTVGPPLRVASLSAVIHNTSGHIRVNWSPTSWNGASSGSYSIGRLDVGDPVPTACTTAHRPGLADGVSPASSGWVDTNVTDGDQYVYIVYSDNGMYCTPTVSGAVESKKPPGPAAGSASLQANGDSGQFDLRADNNLNASGIVGKFQYQLNGAGPWRTVVDGQWLTSFADATVYGNPQSVVFRACREAANDDYCGAGSAGQSLTPVNARATLLSCVVNNMPTSTRPVNGGTPTVTLLYSYNAGVLGSYPEDGWSSYSSTDVAPYPNLPTDQTAVRVKARVQFGADPSDTDPSYLDPGFDEGRCSSQ